MTEYEIRQKVVERATSQLGVKKGSAAHHHIVDTYNSLYPNLPLRNGKPYKLTYNDNWCAAFVSYVSITLGYTDIMPVECSCTEMVKLYQGLGRWVEDDDHTPQIGDVIMWYWEDGPDYATTDQKNNPNHTGIITNVNNKSLVVIEGNKGSSSVVGYRDAKVNGLYIRGYGCPDYASKADKPKAPWYQKEAEWAVEMGIADGTRGGDAVTRGEVWTMLHRLYDKI